MNFFYVSRASIGPERQSELPCNISIGTFLGTSFTQYSTERFIISFLEPPKASLKTFFISGLRLAFLTKLYNPDFIHIALTHFIFFKAKNVIMPPRLAPYIPIFSIFTKERDFNMS